MSKRGPYQILEEEIKRHEIVTSGLHVEIDRLRAAMQELIDTTGGHSHWNVGGVGGRCALCDSDREAKDKARKVLEG